MNQPTAAERKSRALQRLEQDRDVLVASAGDGGRPHLVPLSLAWDGRRILLATDGRSITARNLISSKSARLMLGHSRDVVMIDAAVVCVPTGDVEQAVARTFTERTGWDPGGQTGDWVYLLAAPEKVQVWRSVEEIPGRLVMDGGRWLV